MPRNYRFTDEDRERSRGLEQRRRERINSLPRDFKKDDRELVKQMFDHKCGYCGAPELDVALEFDHFVDIFEDECPGTVPFNMVPSCRPCNRRKGTRGARYILSVDKYNEVANRLNSLGGSHSLIKNVTEDNEHGTNS